MSSLDRGALDADIERFVRGGIAAVAYETQLFYAARALRGARSANLREALTEAREALTAAAKKAADMAHHLRGRLPFFVAMPGTLTREIVQIDDTARRHRGRLTLEVKSALDAVAAKIEEREEGAGKLRGAIDTKLVALRSSVLGRREMTVADIAETARETRT